MKSTIAKEVSKETAKRFLISMQRFLQKNGKAGTLEAIKQLECIQLDPISVILPNQHLVLHNRVIDYEPSYLGELLYKDRLVFEYWCNEKSVVPIEDFRFFRYRMENPTQFHSPFYERIKAQRKEMQTQINQVLSEIKTHGPLSARELEQKGNMEGKTATKILNLLWDCGDLMIHHADGNRRYYELTKRALRQHTDVKAPTREEYERYMIRKYMRAYRLVDTRDWRFGWLPLQASQRKNIVEKMVEDGELYPVRIDSVKHTYWVLEEHLPLLEDPEPPISSRIHFIAPLDNLLWNRRMISEIFDFNYSWEVFKVPEKRIYGYYVMPILRGTRFVGRLDPKLDRQNRTMIINSLLLEEKDFDKSFIVDLADALRRFLEFHCVSKVTVKKTHPEKLKNALMRELG
jgi:uncharacterized protein YcaQ